MSMVSGEISRICILFISVSCINFISDASFPAMPQGLCVLPEEIGYSGTVSEDEY